MTASPARSSEMPVSRTFAFAIMVHGEDHRFIHREGQSYEEVDRVFRACQNPEGPEGILVLNDDDRLQIETSEGVVVRSWSPAGGYQSTIDFDGATDIIGAQVIGPDGYNIHGQEDDPFELASFEVLTDNAIKTARNWASDHPGYAVVPVFEGDVENPSFVSEVSRPAAATPPGI